MQARKKNDEVSTLIRRPMLIAGGRVMLAIACISLLALILIGARLLAAGKENQTGIDESREGQEAIGAATSIAAADESQPNVIRVGVVAGHAGYDSGAVCPDGLTEAQVNLAVAQEVVALLQRKGYQVDLLEEYDDRLTGYRADALVSIHADSCDVPGATGFKVARVTYSAIPEDEDQLVDCIYNEYEAATNLPRHPSSITDNMTNYHAFREIDYYTPGAIIETGFMLDDHDLLVYRPKVVARGIAAGIVCFLERGE
jgi:N-acetylmuramoyl-L-alanine amidase